MQRERAGITPEIGAEGEVWSTTLRNRPRVSSCRSEARACVHDDEHGEAGGMNDPTTSIGATSPVNVTTAPNDGPSRAKTGVTPPDRSVRAPDVLSQAQWQAIVRSLALSNREAEMIRLANYDENVSVIAAHLGLSPNTVHTYRERLYRKLGVSSFCQVIAVVFAAHLVVEQARLQQTVDEH